jgi:hypothetical protein
LGVSYLGLKESGRWDLPVSLQSGPIRIFGPTEGYDWRAAKLFPTVKCTGSVCCQVTTGIHEYPSRPMLMTVAPFGNPSNSIAFHLLTQGEQFTTKMSKALAHIQKMH